MLLFFDDILVFSPALELHLQHLRTVLELLLQHQLHAKRSKCVFGCLEVKYLGHIISTQGVSTNLRKTATMVAWPSPTSVKALKGFLGLTNYYRKFIQNYGQIVAPLTTLLKRMPLFGPFKLKKLFNNSRIVNLLSQLCLTLINPSLLSVMHQGVAQGLLTFLMQNHRPIVFHSQLLKGKALQLSTYEKKLLALVTTVHKWRPYLLGRPFIIKTDHKT